MTPMGVIFRSAFTVMNRGRACSPVLPTERIAYLSRAVRLEILARSRCFPLHS
jgi:hypothetical protein